MALPSQSARPIARRHNMYRRSRRKRRPRAWAVGVLAVVAVVIVVVVIQLWPRAGEAGPDQPADERELLARHGEAQGSLGTDSASLRLPAPPVSPAPPAHAERVESPETQRPAPRQEQAQGPGGGMPEIQMGEDVPAGTGSHASPTFASQPEAVPAPPADDPETAGRGAPSSDAARRALARAQAGLDLVARNEPVQARRLLTQALDSDALSPGDAQTVRKALVNLNDRLVFSPEIVEGDPFAVAYTIQGGDAMSTIPRKMGVQTDWRFVQRINRIPDPRRIRDGQRIKLITGPFHAVIHKRDYRLDLYLGDGAERVYVRSFPVGLGEYNSTPEGRFRIRPTSRLKNPEWVNPRTGRRYRSGDPDNPIGEHWIGLAGDEERLAGVVGYGIHGTIEPDSIGRQSSMGCVRLLPEDIEIVWEVLLDPVSTVEIRR